MSCEHCFQYDCFSGCDKAKLDRLKSENALLRKVEKAARNMLGGHFNLYKSVFGETSDPNNDIVRKDLTKALSDLDKAGENR